MTSRRSILIFWALIIIPAVILGWAAVSLLSHEQDRLQNTEVRALTQRARTIAASIDLALVTVQETLTRALFELDVQNDLESRLVSWEKTNPLVRNVFIFSPLSGLKYPLRTMAATPEERQFISRFDPFFSGRMPFNVGQAPGDEKKEAPPSLTRRLYDLSRAKKTLPLEGEIQAQLSLPAREAGSGWIPWFSGNSLYILGWVQKEEKGPVYGIELELMTLLSRFTSEFTGDSRDNTTLALMDGSGQVLHQAGTLAVEDNTSPLARVLVSPGLPHWQITIFAGPDAFDRGEMFFFLSLTVLGLLIMAIFSGGLLMTRLTLNKIRDAQEKTSFVASVSHELKTPLTSIRMYGELLLSRRVTDPDKQDRYLGVIVGESLRLTRLINTVLDFGKLEQGKKRYHPTRFDPGVFLKTLIQAQKIRITQAGFEVIQEVASGDYEVKTDQDAIEQAMLNLLDNALKYASQGRFIRFFLKPKDQWMLMGISDDGPGIDRAESERIFEKFFRADDSITASQPGSGLGLSIGRQMLRDLGGDLVLETGSGRGACFTLKIPLERDE